jgi:hypothetical protein
MPRLKFFQTRSKFKIKVTRSKFKIKVTRSKVLVSKERSLHNASISQVSKLLSTFGLKDKIQVNVFQNLVKVQDKGH